LLDAVGDGAGGRALRREEATAAKFAGDDAHGVTITVMA
jgi:hypothetical protein